MSVTLDKEPQLSGDDARVNRGVGEAMAGVAFRDPVGLQGEVAALHSEIAKILVRAPSLPIELPAFGLTLLAAGSTKRGIDLVLGKESPFARLRIEKAAGDALPTAQGRVPVVQVGVVNEHSAAHRFERQLRAMALRVQASITEEKWRAAMVVAKKVADLPVDVPLAFYRQLVPGVGEQGLVRTGFNCNQNCGICWQDRKWGRYGSEQVLVWIEDLFAAGARRLIISGGEPTLDPQLESYVRRARELGFLSVTLETNAIQFSKPGHAERLRDAGMTDCFVSLHSGDAATSDAITRAPGTFPRTVAGCKALLEAGVPVRFNCVMTREGIDHLQGVPEFLMSNFGEYPSGRSLMLSQPTDPWDRTLLPTIIPEPERLRTVLASVIDQAFDIGVEVSGLDGPCGPPLCAFGADKRITKLTPISEEIEGRTYLAACEKCSVRKSCFGVRVADVELYGEACAKPIAGEAHLVG